METRDRWTAYNEAGADAPPRPRLVETLDKYFTDHKGRALDLGCGGGRDVRELLRRGWEVYAVDSNERAIEITSQLATTSPQQLEVLCCSFESLSLGSRTFDLINASYALPFCSSDIFIRLFQDLKNTLKDGGIISCDLFGVRDSWNLPERTGMCFFEITEVESFFKDFEILSLKEDETDSVSFSGDKKHWHVFSIVARWRQKR